MRCCDARKRNFPPAGATGTSKCGAILRGTKDRTGDRIPERGVDVQEFIVANPQRYSIRIADVRRANLKQFPYHINYVIHGGAIAIVAISHNKQRPFFWGERLADRGWITG